MPLLFQLLASGSKGNAVLLSSPTTQVLVDAGLSGKETSRRLDKTFAHPGALQGLVVTHEHQDHVRGVGVLSRRFGLPVYLTRGTLERLPHSVGTLAEVQLFQPGQAFTIGDLTFHAFSTSHDAADPVGFVVEHNGTRLGVCTDLGTATQLVKTRLAGCHGLIVEANHDPQLLMNGPYPFHLKQRIRSRHGHLSNEDTCHLLETLHHASLRTVVLAHLSEVNNRPDLVTRCVASHLAGPHWSPIRFIVAAQHEVSEEAELP